MPTTLEHSQYGFDRDSRRTWQKRALTSMQDQCYGYDTLSQMNAAALGSLNSNLTAIAGVPAAAQSWEYDPTGNWRGYHAAANGTATLDQHRVHDRGNRMTQIEGNPHNMILDRVGRMRQMAPDASGDWDGKLEITWDAWSRITSVKDNGEVVGEYTYDGLTRRVTREVGGETLHSYYNDQWRPVEERKDAETTAAVSYLWGARHRDDLVRRDRAVGGTMLNETRYVLMDYFNPAALTDEEGEVTERYAFSAFGVRTILNRDFTNRSSSECDMGFAFHGQFIDLESGLMNYGYRYYSPHLGRWTCKDPIGEKGGINLYGMVGNDGVNRHDYLGLADNKLPACCCVEDIDAVIAGPMQGGKTMNDYFPGIDQGLVGNQPGQTGPWTTPNRVGVNVQITSSTSGNSEKCHFTQDIYVDTQIINGEKGLMHDTEFDDIEANEFDESQAPFRQPVNGSPSMADPPGMPRFPNTTYSATFTTCLRSGGASFRTTCIYEKCCINWRIKFVTDGNGNVTTREVEKLRKECTLSD